MIRPDTLHLRIASEYLWSARNVKRMVLANPERRDTPQTRSLITEKVNLARRHNHLALRYRNEYGR